MPLKKGKNTAAAKKEALADPATLKDGNANHYVGGWSCHQDITDISDISRNVVTAHTAEDRNVAALPRTNILLLPTTAGHEDGETTPATIEVADKMQIEGVAHKTVRARQANVKTWERPTDSASSTQGGAAGETAVEAAPPPVTEDEEGVPAVTEDTSQRPQTTPNAQETDERANPEKDVPANPLEDVVTLVGADFSADDVRLRGAVDFVGVLPQVVVKPELPTPPKTTEPAATAQKSRKKSSASSSRRKSVKQKLTPEELAELEQKKAEEEAVFLKQTEEAVALAAAQERYLMTFAHPNRWAHVTVTNITFAGPVVVRRSHVVFQNCRFTAPAAATPQLTVSQYCDAQCVKCTFDAPARCGVYALPTAQVSLKKCLFTGIPHAQLVALGGEEGRRLGGVVAPAPAGRGGGAEGEDDDPTLAGFTAEETGAAAAFGAGPAAAPEADESVLAAELQHANEEARAARPSSVGVHVDCAKIDVDGCQFAFLGTGVLLHGSYAFAPQHATSKGKAKQPAAAAAAAALPMVVQSSQFQYMYSTAIVMAAQGVLVRRNTITDCEYYALDCRGAACRNANVHENHFGFHAATRIREKAQAALWRNEFHCIPVDDNSRENPCMEEVY